MPRDAVPEDAVPEDAVPEDAILVAREDHLGIITLNRPEKLNALNEQVRQDIMTAVDDFATDDAVRVVIVHGKGEKAFIAGADISEFAARAAEEQRQVYQRRRVYDAIAEFPKPIIAAIHGYCLGGGNEIALACDLRVADRSAQFSQAEIRVGIIPGAGGTQRLARLVGPGQALRMALTGEFIDAEEAHRIGLVEFLVDEGRHLDRAMEIGSKMARWSPVALGLIKKSVQAAMEMPLTEGLELEKELFLHAFASEDGREGVTAFVEKRKPVFKGR